MDGSKLYYDRNTAPLKYLKFLRVIFLIATAASFVMAGVSGFQYDGALRAAVNNVQAVLDLFICIGLYAFKMYGLVLMFLLWLGQTGLYVWDLVTGSGFFGMSNTELIIAIAVNVFVIVLSFLYFRRRRPLFEPYKGGNVAEDVPMRTAPAAATVQNNVPQPVNSNTHTDKLKQAYSHFNASGVSRLFPGGIAQADNVVVSLAAMFGIDLHSCAYEDYFNLLKVYADIAISKEIKKERNASMLSSVLKGNPYVLRSMADAQFADAFFELNRADSSFAVTDIAKYNQVTAKMLELYGESAVGSLRQGRPVFSSPSVTQQGVWFEANAAPAPQAPQAGAAAGYAYVPLKEVEPVLPVQTAGVPAGEAEEAPVQQPPVPRFCGNCGAALTEGALFCGNCGAKVRL